MATSIVVFFDIGNTLAVADFTSQGKLKSFKPFPFVTEILRLLRHANRRLGVISNTGNESAQLVTKLLQDAGLLEHFESGLLLFSSAEGMDKNNPEFFALAATRAGSPAVRCIYVGEDEKERQTAQSASFNVSFHPLHVFHVIEQLSL
jgi:bacterial leucyl aminopeptidase